VLLDGTGNNYTWESGIDISWESNNNINIEEE
jgi:hypothetical protein